MQPSEIILIPPTHEQSNPTFHAEGSLAPSFLAFLESKGLKAWQPPEKLEKRGPDQRRIVEISVESGTPLDTLDPLIDEFLKSGRVTREEAADPSVIGKDLRETPPRSPRNRLHEYVILARTIDKCRASLAGTLGGYHYNCPLDNMLFAFKGVTGEEFKTRVAARGTDEDIAVWFEQAGVEKTPGEVRQWSMETEATKPYDDPDRREWFKGECAPLGLDPAQATLFDYLEADDAAFLAKR